MKPVSSFTGRLANAGLASVALLLGAALWLPLVHVLFVRSPKVFSPTESGIVPKAQALAARHCGSNQVGDAVMLYATVLGPVWRRVKQEQH